VRILYVTLGIVVVDQITKLLVKGFTLPFLNFYFSGMQLGQSIPVIGNFLRLTYIENLGMAFGIDVGGRLFLIFFSFVASIGILYYLYRVRNDSFIVRLPLAMILGGAIGNLIDRIFYGVIFGEAPLFYGKVVDFIDVDFFNINFLGIHMSRWAVFNVADASVTVGIAIMLIFYRRFTNSEEQSESGKIVKNASPAPSESRETDHAGSGTNSSAQSS
jgi:signal peptidase II